MNTATRAALGACAFGLPLLIPPALSAGDLEVGRQLAQQICAACHQADGRSKDPRVPILAGQHAAYLAKQLRASRASERRHPLMNAVASELDDAGIDGAAAYFAAQRGLGD